MKRSKLTPILCALALLLSLGLPACQPKETSAGETADGPAWSLAHWQAKHKRDVLVDEATAAADIRARLVAVRPN